MSNPIWTATQDAYRDQLRRLLKRGRLWREWGYRPGYVLYRVLGAIASSWVVVHNRARDMVEVEAFPDTADETLEAWERAYGLPDDYVPTLGATDAIRRLDLTGKVVSTGGQSPAYLARVAEQASGKVGVVVSELPYGASFRPGAPVAGLVGPTKISGAWPAFYFLVTAPVPASTPMEAAVNRAKPANSVAVFAYV